MRRFLFGVVIASVTAAMPAWALGGDREIAKNVMTELKEHKDSGRLKGFDIDLKVQDGVVYVTGEVASTMQRALIVKSAAQAVGIDNVVSELTIKEAKPAAPKQPVAVPAQPKVQETAVQPASTTTPVARPAAAKQPTVNDTAVTDAIIGRLGESKNAGMLRGFELDVSTVNGDVWLRGKVSTDEQKQHVLDVARRVRGVSRVIDDISVVAKQSPVMNPEMAVQNVERPVRQVSTGGLEPAPGTPIPVPQVSSMPVVGQPGGPQAFAPSGVAGYVEGGYVEGGYVEGGYAGTPVPMNGANYGVGAPRYDQPNMPSYAWPSYAAHPNYAAVTYPKQYSPSAWPYIGPFYPYPQVPLGWRKVSLEWDDGLWYLDFTSK